VKEIRYVIKDELGIHARPAGLLVKMLSEFSSMIRVGTPAKMVDGKRLFSIMGLGLKQGDEMILTFNGLDENEAASKAEAFLHINL
jgi:phosphocarrier protein